MKVMCGTAEFLAPEVISYDTVSSPTDMVRPSHQRRSLDITLIQWAVGVISYILLSGYSPFLGDSDQETFNNITR